MGRTRRQVRDERVLKGFFCRTDLLVFTMFISLLKRLSETRSISGGDLRAADCLRDCLGTIGRIQFAPCVLQMGKDRRP